LKTLKQKTVLSEGNILHEQVIHEGINGQCGTEIEDYSKSD